MPTTEDKPLPPALAELASEFCELAESERLQLLLELSDDLPALPERYAARRDLMEQVHECQSPLFLAVEIDSHHIIHVYFDAPAESPTTRGFAGILRSGLNGLTTEAVLNVPDDAPFRFGLAEAVSPLRLRGMAAMLTRIKRQVRDHQTKQTSTH
ncbi:MAG: SufE family protein [Actinomycetota bacterium]